MAVVAEAFAWISLGFVLVDLTFLQKTSMEIVQIPAFTYVSLTKTLDNFRQQGEMWKELGEKMASKPPSSPTFMILHSTDPIVVETCWPCEKGSLVYHPYNLPRIAEPLI